MELPAERRPTVSVVVPTYNHRDYVLQALESVFAQTFTAYEVIVVNDGSPDDTESLLRPLIEGGRIVYLEQENQGQAAARNRGWQAARGEYVAFLDDDDLWPPEKLEWQAGVLDEQPQTVLVYGPPARLHPDGTISPPRPEAHPSGQVYDALLRRYCLLSPGQALIRTSVLRKVGGFDTDLWGVDDWDLYVRLAREGEFQYVDQVALYYRLHHGNASRSALRHAENAWKAIRKHSGWNLPLVVAQMRAGADYFVPNLLQFAEEAQARGRRGESLRAHTYAAVFRPALLLQRSFVASLVRLLLPWERV